jgi:integrase-like protein
MTLRRFDAVHGRRLEYGRRGRTYGSPRSGGLLQGSGPRSACCARCRKAAGRALRTARARDYDPRSKSKAASWSGPLRGSQPLMTIKKMGFATKASALEDMHRAQTARADGTYLAPSKQTLADYLETWVKGGCGGVRPWTLKGYESVVRVHIVPRLGRIPIQHLGRATSGRCTRSFAPRAARPS